jgi:hypothetical protein
MYSKQCALCPAYSKSVVPRLKAAATQQSELQTPETETAADDQQPAAVAVQSKHALLQSAQLPLALIHLENVHIARERGARRSIHIAHWCRRQLSVNRPDLLDLHAPRLQADKVNSPECALPCGCRPLMEVGAGSCAAAAAVSVHARSGSACTQRHRARATCAQRTLRSIARDSRISCSCRALCHRLRLP